MQNDDNLSSVALQFGRGEIYPLSGNFASLKTLLPPWGSDC